MAGRASVELHTLIFFRSRQVVADARVTKASLPARPPACLPARSSGIRPFLRPAACLISVPSLLILASHSLS